MGAVEQGKSSHEKEESTAIDDRLRTANRNCARQDHRREATTQPPHLYARAGNNYNHLPWARDNPTTNRQDAKPTWEGSSENKALALFYFFVSRFAGDLQVKKLLSFFNQGVE